VLLPFCVGSLQVAAGLAVLERPDLVAARVDAARRERVRVAASLRELPGVTVHDSGTNFLLFTVDDPAAVHAGPLARGVAVWRQDHLAGLAGCLRVSVGLPAENDAFLTSLADVLAHEVAARG